MKEKSTIYFFFDECFHDREINIKNISNEDTFFYNYIMLGLGIKKENKQRNSEMYQQFEEKYKKIFSIPKEDELKSGIVTKKQYKYGLKSFNKQSLDLYDNFFDLLNNSDYLYYIFVSNKFEYILSQMTYSYTGFVKYESLMYSIIKLINVYRPTKIIKMIFNKDIGLLDELISFFYSKFIENQNKEFKKIENRVIMNCIIMLNEIKNQNIVPKWEYKPIFTGFEKFINEIKFDKENVDITIDKEGNKSLNTYQACIDTGFLNSIEKDSKESLELRCADMLCGFIGRMMRGIWENNKVAEGEEYSERKILSEEWFNIDERRFLLYKKIIKYIKRQSNLYWSTYISLYFDNFLEFLCLLYYFDNFKDYSQYKETSIQIHREHYNTYACIELDRRYRINGL